MSVKRPVRRYRVALRAKVRRQRLRFLAVAAALTALGAAATLTVRHMSRSLPSVPNLFSRFRGSAETVEVKGASEMLAGPIAAYLREPGESFRARAARLTQRFPAVKTARVSDDWARRHALVEVTLRHAVGRVLRAGRPAGFLDEDGSVFDAPAALYPEAQLIVEAGEAGAGQLQALPSALAVFSRDADLPAPVVRLSFRSVYEGWEVWLQDGTQILWGNLIWTREKIARLREVLVDARERDPATSVAADAGRKEICPAGACGSGIGSSAGGQHWVADLRYFEDGRVLLKPLFATR